jgi:uncharacterized YccA/Bax inhibitor family protein
VRSSNPVLGEKTFVRFVEAGPAPNTMTLPGVVNRTAFLFLLLVAAASVTWAQVANNPQNVMPMMMGGAFLGFIVAMVTAFKPEWSPFTSPVYALLEGLFLGGISAIFEGLYPGIVMQAVGCTFGTMFCLLAAYRSGLIRATENFKLMVVSATGGIALLYLVSFGLRLFTSYSIPFIHEGGIWGIAFSLFVVAIAALNLVLDFDFIEQGVEAGAPKFMEWYAAFGLMVTLVWLYLEILKLLAKLRGRD